MQFIRPALLHVAALALALLAGCGGGGTTTLNNPPGPSSFTISGTVTGLPTGASLVLKAAGQSATVSSNGSFNLTMSLASGSPYTVTIGTQPAGESCTVSGGSGIVGAANNPSIAITCTSATFTIGGTVAGLASGESVILDDNGGNAMTVSASGAFTFASPIDANGTYSVTVATQPTGQTCTVAGGSGTVTSANIANVVVTCSDQAYNLGGTIQGLNGSGLVLANGTDTVTVASGDTSFTLPTAVAYTSSYTVTVKTQPTGLACAVTAGSGTMPAHAVTTVAVSCTDQPFSLGGTVSGLGANTGLVLANAGQTYSVPASATTFTLPTSVSFDSPYAVTVQSAPAGLTCTLSHGSGTMPASNVTNIAVTCADQDYTIGGSVSGLTASGLVLANGSDTLTVAANATSFTMPTPVAYTSPYAVVVQSAPAYTTCTIGNGSGTMATADVTNITVTCAPVTFTVGGTISCLGSLSGLTLANGSDTLSVLANATTFTMPTGVANGSNYDVTVEAHPFLEACSVTDGSGTVAGADVTNVAVACAASESVLYSFSGATSDGAYPEYSHLTLGSDGNFYGLTVEGGSANKGAVFKVTPAGVETVLHFFAGGNTDGAYPSASLVQGSDGDFYGMTNQGGANNKGTVFKITPTGTETVLYSFAGGSDGEYSYGNLVPGSDGNFYGMTYEGGAHNKGTVFKITPTGLETVLYSFAGGSDGANPYGSLVQGSDGNFYGMTEVGGTHSEGAVFKITSTGTETVLWSFGSGSDGTYPTGSLVQGSDGNFYSMTYYGGAHGAGTVFKITPAGSESVLWSFASSATDGGDPTGSLVQGSDGNFYGMTSTGGANGTGTIFQITPTGTETLLWSFGTGSDGNSPYGDLIFGPDGALYGVTDAGGTYGDGAVIEYN